MSNRASLAEEKSKVKSKIGEITGKRFFPHKGREDWIVSDDGKLCVFVAASSLHLSKKYWFDLAVMDVIAWDRFERAMIIFLLGGSERILIVPANDLFDLLKRSGRNLRMVSDATVKLHIERHDGEFVLFEASRASMSEYYNRYDLLTR